MTIAMPDSVRVGDLPDGYPAYLGYADGDWPTATELAVRFPHAHRVILTVTAHSMADGIDIEPGDVGASVGAAWAWDRLRVNPRSRPVLYASVEGQPGYGMHDIISELARWGISRAQVRLLSAHYGAGEHICGPASCGLITVEMDGTQWTDQYRVTVDNSARLVDMSALVPGFFGDQTRTETEIIVQELGVVRQGDTGQAVRTVQALCQARGDYLPPLKIDGVYGPATMLAVTRIQAVHRLAVDGVVGPATWPVLLGVA